MTTWRSWSRCLVTVVVLTACGCAPSEEEVQRKFDGYVNGANSCTAVGECAQAAAGCPLGCAVAVRKERVADVEAKARELIKEYERGGRRCDYGCRRVEALACLANRCTVLYDPLPDGGASDLP